MINKLIEKYKSKIKDTQQDMYKNEIPLDFTEGFDESINPEEYTCYPIELWEEILQDLKKVKEPTICGHTVEEIITILNGLELERKLDIKMTMENLQILSKKLQEDFQKTLDNSMKNMIDNCGGN